MAKKGKRYWFLRLDITCGEYEFRSDSVHTTNGSEFDAEGYAMNFYDGLDDDETEDGVYKFNGGEVSCCVHTRDEITKKEYDVLETYL